jgi:aspartate/methionine/tyrosine aminotransferase
LTDVAVNWPDLNWAEGFSASKVGNFCGWRVGAMVGTPEFMADITKEKGEHDSGLAAAMAIGVDEVIRRHPEYLIQVRNLYGERIHTLKTICTAAGMRVEFDPQGGFFLLFECPKEAFGRKIESPTDFNSLMIEKTGIVGVPFAGKYIRYTVAGTDVVDLETELSEKFSLAKIKS